MRLFLDTAEIEEIREINRWGVLGGVTTNPTLVAKTRSEADAVWRQILSEVAGDVSLETTEPEADGMHALRQICDIYAIQGVDANARRP